MKIEIELTCQKWISLLENTFNLDKYSIEDFLSIITDNSFFYQLLLTEELKEFLLKKEFRSEFEDQLLKIVF